VEYAAGVRPTGERGADIHVRVALTVALGLAVGACDGRGAASDRHPADGRDPAMLIVGRPADSISLDPARVTDNESVEVVAQIYQGLVRHRPGSTELEPGLATDWEVSEGGTAWTFHLRRGVRFHDGTPVDAAAVAFSFRRILDPAHRFHQPDSTGLGFEYAASLYQNILAVDALDPLTVRIRIRERYAPLEANLAVFAASIVSPTAVARYGKTFFRHPVGSGPFRFVSWQNGVIVLERNADHWDGVPSFRRLVFRTMPDGRQRLTALEAGAIDVAYSILPDELQSVALHPDLRLHRAAVSSVAYLALNTSHPPFDDVRVRQAANMAINKDPIVELAYQGLAQRADGPLPSTQWGHHAGATRYPYDPAAARALLDRAISDGGVDPSKRYRLFVPATPRPYLPSPEAVGRAIQANLAVVGLQTELVVQPFPAHLAAVQRGDHDLCLLGWVDDSGDPDNFLYTLLGSDNATLGAARNVAFLRDAELDGLLREAQFGVGQPAREKLYLAAQDRIAALAPWVPLAHAHVAVAARAEIGGIVVNPSSHIHYQGVRRLGR
jgi:peptide/nickel transport system substrate-binding protein